VLARTGTDEGHLGGVDGKGVFDVARGEGWVYCSGPGAGDMVNRC
jgi:hypothetical protein